MKKIKSNIYRIIRFVLLILCFAFLFSFSASNDPLTRIVDGFTRYIEKQRPEKIYIHFDRTHYKAGEVMWFKAYLSEGVYHEPSQLSRVIYIEFINQDGRLIKHVKLLSLNGSAAGSLLIPDSLRTGDLLVRAYTKWMRNSNEAYFFHRLVKIRNDELAPNTFANTNTDSLDVQFFPEGGELVNGIQSKLAFKAIGANGMGRYIKGKVLDGSKVIGEFESNALGMGAFHVTPIKGKVYTAIIEDYGREVKLPTCKDTGLVMSVNSIASADQIFIKVQATDYTQLKTIYILAQTRGVVSYTARVNLSTNLAVAKIPKAALPAGISQIIVTDLNGIPLAERLVFIDQEECMHITLSTNKAIYSPRELVSLDIKVTDAAGNPVIADLSLSVFDSRQAPVDLNGETITSYLLLSSELTGYLESPGYYFNVANKDRAEALDYLLLTQGWRRFTIKDALAQDEKTLPFKVERGLTISGSMVDLYNSKPIVDGKVSCLSLYPNPETKTVFTNAKGLFEFNDLLYFDSTDVMLQGETKRGSKATKIIVDHSYNSPKLNFPGLNLNRNQPESDLVFFTKRSERKAIEGVYDLKEDVVMLDEMEVVGKRDDSQGIMSKSFGRGTVNVKVSSITAQENQTHPLLLLQGRVAGVQVSGSGQNWKVLIQGVGSINSGTTPLIMVDDIPVPIELLHTIPVLDLESFSVWKGADAAIFGARGANGAIGFYTRKGAKGIETSNEKPMTFGSRGFQIEREFYAPKYDVAKSAHAKPDKRNTLHWAPFIQTDSLGKAALSFFNHDEEGSIKGVIEGISVRGLPGSSTFDYTIKKE